MGTVVRECICLSRWLASRRFGPREVACEGERGRALEVALPTCHGFPTTRDVTLFPIVLDPGVACFNAVPHPYCGVRMHVGRIPTSNVYRVYIGAACAWPSAGESANSGAHARADAHELCLHCQGAPEAHRCRVQGAVS